MCSSVEHEDMELDDSSSTEIKSSGDESDEDVEYANFEHAPDNTIQDMTFASTEDANSFYKAYGRQKGFKTRKCHTYRINNIIKNMKWECSLAGFRKPRKEGLKNIRKSKPDTKCGCKACFRIALQNGIYRVTRFVSEHNHDLETTKTSKMPRRYISPGNKSLISSLSAAGIKTSQILDYLKLVEGPSDLPFTNKDVHNYLAKERRNFVQHGDATTALYLMDGMKIGDKDFVYEKTLNGDGSLNKLFWTDGLAREQYKLFGDALVFDSTYKTNTYNFPFVILSGVDNNMNTCVFGCALIQNETYESFFWLLQTFIRLMGGQAPLSVVTDEDGAMRKAIKVVFPETKHRLCNWHLVRNCREHIHVSEFCNEFSKLTVKNLSIDQFEQSWKRIIEEYGVSENSWVLDAYSKRKMWAEAYFRGHFTGMMRSNQRAESMNSRFKASGKKGYNLCEFLKHFFNELHNLRLAAYKVQCESELAEKSANHVALRSFVDHASAVYSTSVRKLVHKEIAREQTLVLVGSSILGSGVKKFILKKYDWLDGWQWSVEIDEAREIFNCECKMLESMGFPCRHLFFGFKQMGLKKIPTPCIRERWTTTIGKKLCVYLTNLFSATDPQRQRFMRLHRESVGLCLDASQSEIDTNEILKVMQNAKETLTDLTQSCSKIPETPKINGEQNEVRDPIRQSQNYGVGNPTKMKSRGAPRNKKQKCGCCGNPGHKIGRCPNKNNFEQNKSDLKKGGDAP